MAITLQFVAALQNPAPAAAAASTALTAAGEGAAAVLPFAALFDDLLKPQDLSAQMTATLMAAGADESELGTEAPLAAAPDAATQALLASLNLLPAAAPIVDAAGQTDIAEGVTAELPVSSGTAATAQADLLALTQQAGETPMTASGATPQLNAAQAQADAPVEIAAGEIKLPEAPANLAAAVLGSKVRADMSEPDLQLAEPTMPNTLTSEAAATRPAGQPAQPSAVAAPVRAEYHIPEPVAGSRWADALGQRALFMVEQQVKTAELHLNPPHLGPLEVKLALDGDKASLSFSSNQAAVREAVQQSLPRLQQVFADNGLAELNVQIHLGQQNQPQQQERQLAQEGGRDESNDSSARSLVVDMSAVQRSRWQVQSYASARGGVDTFA